VRDTHSELDFTTIKLGERFVTDSGDRAEFPGGFGVPSEDINCRCSTLPVVKG
jgi:hypothetical protein